MFEVQLEKYAQGGYRIYRVPGIICTRKGTLIVCYECRYGGDWSAMDLVVRRSTDGGRIWSDRVLVASGRKIDVVHNGILFADGDRVHLLWHRNYRQGFCMTSSDEGQTWSEPVEMSAAYEQLRDRYNWTVIAAGPGHGLTTSSGRMIIPVWVSANRELITSHHPSVVTTLYSDDHGKTWACGEIIWDTRDFVDPNESVLAELSDGRMMMNSRHETGEDCRKVGYSPDGIHEWSRFESDLRLMDPVCCAGMTQGDGYLWFVNCACTRKEGRRHLTVRQSADDGNTWPCALEIALDGGYSDICYDPRNRMLHIIAETGRATEDPFSFGLSVFSFFISEIEGRKELA